MKARFYPVVLSLAVGLAAHCLAREPETPPAPFAFVDADAPALADIRRLGERTIDQVGGAMLVEVRRVLNKQEPAFAVGQLHLKNYKLPAPEPGQPAVTAVRRTGLRVRNPANAPDAADRAALDFVKRQLDRGQDVARVLVQKVEFPGQPPEWRVYRPLATMDQCMACHGPPGMIDAGVVAALKQFYPDDTAVDYVPGEWRGLIRVSVAPPAQAK